MIKPTLVVMLVVALVHFGRDNVAQAAEKSVSITPSKSEDSGSSWGGGGMTWSAENAKLYDTLVRLYPGKLAASDAAKALPEGRFDIKLSGYPVKELPAFEALAAEVKKQFGVDVSVVEDERDGYAISLPSTDKVTKADSEDGYVMMTTAKGWSLQAATLTQIAEWLGKELDAPVTAKNAGETKVSFELTISVFKPQELPAALEKIGFVIAKDKVNVKVLKAAKTG